MHSASQPQPRVEVEVKPVPAAVVTAPTVTVKKKKKKDVHPRRPGQAVCEHWRERGTCGYGKYCYYDHPPPPEEKELNIREVEPQMQSVRFFSFFFFFLLEN